MNIFHDKFSTNQIIAATDVTNDNIQNWLRRELIVGQNKIEGGGAQGRPRQWSFFNLIEIAAAKGLIDAGMTDLKAIFRAAGMFAHTGPAPIGNRPGRMPGCPINRSPGFTLLVAGPDWHNVVFVSPEDTAIHLYATLLHGASSKGGVFVNMSDVFNHAVSRVGYHPEDVMQLAYSHQNRVVGD